MKAAIHKSIAVSVVIIAAISIFTIKELNRKKSVQQLPAQPGSIANGDLSASPEELPKLIDLGAGKCIPCKAMAPILDELKENYSSEFTVTFIDVWENPDASEQYGIRSIPTQIFFDSEGSELFRHEGMFTKEQILEKWAEYGVNVESGRDGPEQSGFSLQSLFSAFNSAIEGSPAIVLLAVFLWGIASVILSPCHLASIPLIVGFINGDGVVSSRRAFLLSSLFALGNLATIAIAGYITSRAGRIMGDVGQYGNLIVAIVFLLVGLHLYGVIPMPWSAPGQIKMKWRGPLAALVLGLIFGIALGPCTFAYMIPILAMTLKLADSNLWYGITLLLMYGVGYCTVIILAGTFSGTVQRYLNWTECSKGTLLIKKGCAILVILAGLYLIYK